jgi:hypothetical protein
MSEALWKNGFISSFVYDLTFTKGVLNRVSKNPRLWNMPQPHRFPPPESPFKTWMVVEGFSTAILSNKIIGCCSPLVYVYTKGEQP